MLLFLAVENYNILFHSCLKMVDGGSDVLIIVLSFASFYSVLKMFIS